MKNNLNTHTTDTIIALATPSGRGGIGIIRISGKLVPIIASKLLGKIPHPRTAEYLPILDTNHQSILDRVIVLFFPEPHSFTGENILEIHGHGGQFILNLILEHIIQLSNTEIRLANPGEFTERAFLNGKIDLIQAESIADIIDANSYQAARSASRTLQGTFSKKIHVILKKITTLRVDIESSIDFSEEPINEISFDIIKTTLKNILNEIKLVCELTHHGIMIREGLKIVIAGKTNAGKSSLFNTLIGIDRAIISTTSGTTRDALHEYIQLQGIALHIVDTAGLENNTNNEVEKISIQRTWSELHDADHILWVVDSSDPINKNEQIMISSMEKTLSSINKQIPITIIRNKSDLSGEKIEQKNTVNNYTIITVSAMLNEGIDILRTYLSHDMLLFLNISDDNNNKKTYFPNENEGNFIARRRHLNILEKSYQYLLSAYNQLHINTTKNNSNTYTIELLAEDLKSGHYELNKIFGKLTSDDLLKEIFSTFCIGK